MTFGAPLALLMGLLAAPIVLFYILKVRQRVQLVPTLMFWEQIYDEKKPRSLFQKLRHFVSLLVQLLLLLLLVLALSQPVLPWQSLQPRRIVLVIDNSASMNATDVAPTRLEAAKAKAKQVVESMRFFDTMIIVESGAKVRVVVGQTSHRRTLLEGIDRVQPTDGLTSLDAAVELADRLLADESPDAIGDESAGETGQILLVSDGRIPDREQVLADARVSFVPIGNSSSNIGITSFRVRRSLVDPLGFEVLAEVRNYSTEPVACRFEMYLDDEILDVIPLQLDPGERWWRVFEKASVDGGRLVGKLDMTDALPTDNEAYALLPQRKAVPVTLVTEGNVFLQKVFEAVPLVSLNMVSEAPESIAANEVVIFHRKVPSQLPAGNVLVIDPETDSDLWQLTGELENPLVAEEKKDSPLLAHVRLTNVYMPQARKLQATTQDIEVLASTVDGDPLYFSLERANGKAAVLTVNLDRGDLPLRTAFPIMMSNALGWFAGTGGELRESVSVGKLVKVDAADVQLDPATAAAHANGEHTHDTATDPYSQGLVLVSPSGVKMPIQAGQQGELRVGPLAETGYWQVLRDGHAVLEIPCNLLSPEESDLQIPDDEDATLDEVVVAAGSKPMWFHLLTIGIVLLALEWFLYQRRWIS